MVREQRQGLIEWGVSVVPMKGQTESGDKHLIKCLPQGCLVAVIDGLGHGDEAANAAKAAVAILETFAHESLISLIRRCNEQLRSSRGVVMSLAFFDADDETMTWLGVGNVEGVLLRADPQASPTRENILLRGGVVGYQLPQLFASVVSVSKGDTLIFATDGIFNRFAEGLNKAESPQQLAEEICAQYKKESDDALVLVARYMGLPS